VVHKVPADLREALIAGPRRNWKMASADPAAGRVASTATARADSGWRSGIPATA
jgi:hypothetical protein